MKHPFATLSASASRSLFIVSLVLTVVLMMAMNSLGSGLNNPTAPMGIISFELAGTLENAERILSTWDAATLLRLSFSLGLDFLYLVVYATSISLACLWAGKVWQRAGWKASIIGSLAAWGLWLAAGLDAIENLALTRLLFGERLGWLPLVARWAATLKFALILLGLLIALLGLITFLVYPRHKAAA